MRKFLRLLKIAIQGSVKEYTSGSINRAIFLLSIPMILEMVMESLFAVVDVFFVARVSVNAVATVGLTESVITPGLFHCDWIEYGCYGYGCPAGG